MEGIQAVEACGYSSGVPKIMRIEDGARCRSTFHCISESLRIHTVTNPKEGSL